MFNLHTKFEVSMIACNEEMKGNAKCKNSRLSHPLGDLGVTHMIHLWLDGKCIVNFLLAIIELCSLALMAAALLNKICQNQRFLKGWVTECKFELDVDVVHNPSMDC